MKKTALLLVFTVLLTTIGTFCPAVTADVWSQTLTIEQTAEADFEGEKMTSFTDGSGKYVQFLADSNNGGRAATMSYTFNVPADGQYRLDMTSRGNQNQSTWHYVNVFVGDTQVITKKHIEYTEGKENLIVQNLGELTLTEGENTIKIDAVNPSYINVSSITLTQILPLTVAELRANGEAFAENGTVARGADVFEVQFNKSIDTATVSAATAYIEDVSAEVSAAGSTIKFILKETLNYSEEYTIKLIGIEAADEEESFTGDIVFSTADSSADSGTATLDTPSCVLKDGVVTVSGTMKGSASQAIKGRKVSLYITAPDGTGGDTLRASATTDENGAYTLTSALDAPISEDGIYTISVAAEYCTAYSVEKTVNLSISATEATTVKGNECTYNPHSTKGDGYVNLAINTYPGYAFSTYDLNVEEAGMYKVSIRYGTKANVATRFGIYKGYLNKANNTAPNKSSMNLPFTIVEADIAATTGEYNTNTVELGTFAFEKGFMRLGVKNLGASGQMFLWDIIITPVSGYVYDDVEVERYAQDYTLSGNIQKELTTPEGLLSVRFSSAGAYVTYENVYIPESGTYRFAARYAFPYNGYDGFSIKVTADDTVLPLGANNAFALPMMQAQAFVWTASDNTFTLTEGYHDIKIERMGLDPHFAGFKLIQVSEESVSDAVYVSNTKITPFAASSTSAERDKTKTYTYPVIAEEDGIYDVWMKMSTVPLTTSTAYKAIVPVVVSVDNTEQSNFFVDDGSGNATAHWEKVGTLTLKEGKQTIKVVTKFSGATVDSKNYYYGAVNVSGIELRPQGVGIATDVGLTGGTTAAVNALNGMKLSAGETATMSVTVSTPGYRKLYLRATPVNANAASVTLTVNGIQKNISLTGKGYHELLCLGEFYLKTGANDVSVTLNSQDAVYVEQNVFVSKNFAVTLFNTDDTIPQNLTTTLKTGKMIAKVDAGTTATQMCVFAIYDVTNPERPYIAYVSDEAVKADGTVDIIIDGFTMEQDHSYAAKVFAWDVDNLIGSYKGF